MKEILDFFVSRGIVFKDFETVDVKTLGSRKKINIFCATDIKGNFHSIFFSDQKSRILQKDISVFIDIHKKLTDLKDHNFKYMYLLRRGPTCSKAREFLESKNWKYFDFM